MSEFQKALYPGSLLMRSCLEEMHTWSSCSFPDFGMRVNECLSSLE